MSIDWSKAPEGTTHYHIAEDINPWRKIEGTVAYEHYRGKWLRVNSFNEGCMPGYYVPIPRETWDGQGLPPVGVRVSVFDDGDLVYGHGESGEVIAHVEDCAVIRMSYGLGCFTAKNLRTPEQIAAEEREKAVGDMAMSIQGVPYQYPTLYALYDAGYRRQESST
ncbi:TPA: hypothetical protein ACRNDU_000984 [Pseudomonas aeruginosa]|uniref:hypothetical protein n=1 Tax=Pseudomonas aeruginosa TaxID=287 RepID=UPI00071C24A3|nr:hypothetical protein [Pseudomonas aeruginosa]EMB9912256.1 hypothetical protein [Pseudomonas aeruginosa]KSM18399.1 hypothetical protein APA65_26690 [Pseudomonas aeruginosa]MBH4445012.1 hypothetical protein [Pseudomonas aeruginosa]MBH4462944.1 hypothetical protein [Pseudomonas aeruginosa]MBP2698395.1 hypothetical protein [Pseudomonas aeruginosa]